MILRHIPNLCLQHDAALHLLRLEWLPRSDQRQLRASATQLLELLHERQVRQLLFDMNSMPNLSLADQAWIAAHWMPRFVTLPLARLVMAINSNQLHNQLAVDALHDLMQPAFRFEPHYFSDADSAFSWLADGLPHLPALRAEWAGRYA